MKTAKTLKVQLGTAYKKLIKKGQFIMIESIDLGHPSWGGKPAEPPKKGRWITDDHCIDVQDEEPDLGIAGGPCLVVAKMWDETDVLLDKLLDSWVTLKNDCIVGEGFKIWILEQRVVGGLIRKLKIKTRK